MADTVNELERLAEADGATFIRTPMGAWWAKDRDGIVLVRGALSRVEAARLYCEDKDLVASTPAAILAYIKAQYRPYDTLPEFQEGYDACERDRVLRCNPYDDGYKAQAWDRGANAAMLYKRAMAAAERGAVVEKAARKPAQPAPQFSGRDPKDLLSEIAKAVEEAPDEPLRGWRLMTASQIEAAREHYRCSLAAGRINRYEFEAFGAALDRHAQRTLDAIVQAVEKLDPGHGTYVGVWRLKEALPDVTAADIIAAADAGRLVLAPYGGPDRGDPRIVDDWKVIRDDRGEFFIAVALPQEH
jgi:hypothetical protein